MHNLQNVTGARLEVFIQYEDDLKKLGSTLQHYLDISNFRYEYREEEPYDLIGYSEVFGFEIELTYIQSRDCSQDYQFILEAFTTDSFQELFDNNMCDLSLWMARYLSLCDNVITMAKTPDKKYMQKFYYDSTSFKRESVCIELK